MWEVIGMAKYVYRVPIKGKKTKKPKVEKDEKFKVVVNKGFVTYIFNKKHDELKGYEVEE